MGKPRAVTATVIEDPLMGSPDIATWLAVSGEYALQLMKSGAFGPLFDVGSGDRRGRPRVRRSAVEAWIAKRQQVSA